MKKYFSKEVSSNWKGSKSPKGESEQVQIAEGCIRNPPQEAQLLFRPWIARCPHGSLPARSSSEIHPGFEDLTAVSPGALLYFVDCFSSSCQSRHGSCQQLELSQFCCLLPLLTFTPLDRFPIQFKCRLLFKANVKQSDLADWELHRYHQLLLNKHKYRQRWAWTQALPLNVYFWAGKKSV